MSDVTIAWTWVIVPSVMSLKRQTLPSHLFSQRPRVKLDTITLLNGYFAAKNSKIRNFLFPEAVTGLSNSLTKEVTEQVLRNGKTIDSVYFIAGYPHTAGDPAEDNILFIFEISFHVKFNHHDKEWIFKIRALET